ncbi:MAG TPA: nucleotide disphospho-sugar-binding domain-containing protein [Novimethylophilus sp.]|jgi:UDP:flavonoid glycosyltransferase YjiC (YdhE family)|uniref:glycosyltransferase n=1 Tax=Novimethylophilus sp. TaxID=2137426 RepID=UPI002F406BC2
MSQISFAWELGTNAGHVAQIAFPAEGLLAQGHRVACALRDLNAASGLPAECSLLQAPVWLPEVKGLPDPPLNYAEILLRFGYHDPACLNRMISAWRSLFQSMRTDVIVANHGPTALVAARSLNIPAVVLGEGFTIPPVCAPMPNMRPWAQVPAERLASSEKLVTGSINAVLQKYASRPIANLADIFAGPRLLCTFPELDHYRERGDRYYGPIVRNEIGLETEWPEGKGSRVLVYMQPGHRDLLRMLEILSALDCVVLAVVPGLGEDARKRLESTNLRISADPLKLEPLLETCDLAVSYAGHGLVSVCLMAGVPLFLLPTQLEQYLLALRVQNMGAGIAINPEGAQPSYVNSIRQMLASDDYKARAREFADRHAGFDRQAQRDALCTAIENAIEGAPRGG